MVESGYAWRAPLEILILTVGFYGAFRFIRGTRGAPRPIASRVCCTNPGRKIAGLLAGSRAWAAAISKAL